MNTSTTKAQKAVSAAASVNVPKPPKSPMIMITGSISSHLAVQIADAACVKEKGSLTASHCSPLRMPTAATQVIISSSGRIAPVNKRGSGVCEYTQYKMAGTLVGNSRPSEPEAVSKPIEKFSG